MEKFTLIKNGDRCTFRKYGQGGMTVSLSGLPKDGQFSVEDCLGRDITAWVKERQALGEKKLEQLIKVMNFIDRMKYAERLIKDTHKMFGDYNQAVEDLTCAFLTFQEVGQKFIKEHQHLRADRLKGGITPSLHSVVGKE